MSDQDALAQFRSYDWDSCKEWHEYLLNVEVASGRDDAMTKVKVKWFKRNVNSNLDMEDVVKPTTSSYTSGIPETQSKPAATATGTSSARQEPQPSGAQRPNSRSQASSIDPAALQSFVLHMVLIVLAVVYLVPFHRWSRHAYRYFNMVAIASQGNKILSQHGWPKLRPFSGLKDWAVRALSTTDFQYMMMAVMFMPQPPMTMAIVPVLVLAIYHAFAFASQHLAQWSLLKPLWDRYGAKAHQWLKRHQKDALVANATAEISVGFMLIAQLLTPARNFILLYLFWNMLKMRYWSRDASAFHRQAWQALNTRTRPYRNMLPLVDKPIGFVVKWFNAQR